MGEDATNRTQELMDQAYDRWGEDNTMSKEDFWATLSPREKVAVFCGNLNGQVGNGGFGQWDCNRYSDCAVELSGILRRLGPTGRKAAAIVEEAMRRIEDAKEANESQDRCARDDEDDGYEEDEEAHLSDLDDKYWEMSDALLEELEAFLNKSDADFERAMSAEPEKSDAGDIEQKKPKVKLLGTDGNVFAVIGTASRALRRAGMGDKVKEMRERATSADSYHGALAVVLEYVDAY